MKEVQLGKGLITLVDDEDYIELSRYSWSTSANGYAIRRKLDPQSGKQKSIRMHRQILGLSSTNGMSADQREGPFVDHINGNRLDNRKCNLRLCTKSENAQNRGALANNTSGYKGVHWMAQRRKWRAAIGLNGKLYHIGLFLTPEEAYAAYCAKAVELHGKFARLA